MLSILFKRAGNKSLSKGTDLIESIVDQFMIRRSHQEQGQVPSGHQGVSQWPVALTQIQIRPEVGQLIKESAKT